MTTLLGRWTPILGLIFASILVMTHPVHAQADERMSICHQNSDHQTWTLTMAPQEEARAHLATHPDDGIPHQPVPGQRGYLFDSDCKLVSECGCIALGDQPLWGSTSISEDCLQVAAEIDRMVQVTSLSKEWYLSGQWYFTNYYPWLRKPWKDIVLPPRRQTCQSTQKQ